jgi:hypothetical protein
VGGGNSQCVIVRQGTQDKSRVAELEDNLNCSRKKSNFNLSKMWVREGYWITRYAKWKGAFYEKKEKLKKRWESKNIKERKGKERNNEKGVPLPLQTSETASSKQNTQIAIVTS